MEKCECYIHSLKQGEKNVLSEATILKRLGDNDYLAEVGVSGSGVDGLRNDDYSAWHDELLAGYTVSVNGFINWFAKV